MPSLPALRPSHLVRPESSIWRKEGYDPENKQEETCYPSCVFFKTRPRQQDLEPRSGPWPETPGCESGVKLVVCLFSLNLIWFFPQGKMFSLLWTAQLEISHSGSYQTRSGILSVMSSKLWFGLRLYMDALSGTVNGTLSAWKGYLKDRDESKSENHSVVSNSSRPHELYSPWNSPGQNTGVGSLSLLQGIFPTQGSNPGLPHCRIPSQLSHQGSPKQRRHL